MPLNFNLLDRAISAIAKDESKFMMSSWIGNFWFYDGYSLADMTDLIGECGTTMCLGGHVVMCATSEELGEALSSIYGEDPSMKDDETTPISVVAQKLLGLSTETSKALFLVSGWEHYMALATNPSPPCNVDIHRPNLVILKELVALMKADPKLEENLAKASELIRY
jgi:hypothetical protein